MVHPEDTARYLPDSQSTHIQQYWYGLVSEPPLTQSVGQAPHSPLLPVVLWPAPHPYRPWAAGHPPAPRQAALPAVPVAAQL